MRASGCVGHTVHGMATISQSRRRPLRSRIELASRVAEHFDRRPGAHARHLARVRRVEASKWGMIAAPIVGTGLLADAMAVEHDGWLGLLACLLAGIGVVAHWADKHPERARQADLGKALPNAHFWPVLLVGAFGLLVLQAAVSSGTQVVLGVGAVATTAGLLLWYLRVRPLAASARKADAGARNELSVARTLDTVGARVRHSVMIGAGVDADHIVISEQGQIAVIETKSGGGTVRVGDDGRIRRGKSATPILGNPIEQVTRQACVLSRLADGAAVTAIVCVQHMTNEPFHSHGVVLCSERDLPEVIHRLPRRISPAAADELWERLSC